MHAFNLGLRALKHFRDKRVLKRFAFLQADTLVPQKGLKLVACENAHQIVFDR